MWAAGNTASIHIEPGADALHRYRGSEVRTDLGSAAKVDERPVVLVGPAQDVAGLDIAVGIPAAVQFFKPPHSMAERLHGSCGGHTRYQL